MKKALITGITGQDGSYLAEFLLSKDYEVHGIIRRSSSFNTHRIDHIYVDPHTRGAHLFLHYGDLSDSSAITDLIWTIKPDEVYNLGAQSHVRISFDQPEYTGDITGLGTTRVLDALRRSGVKSRFYQASSSEIFGAAPPPQSESTPFHPRSPYAIAKMYAYWMTVNYREGYNMYATNGILFNHESPRRGETFVTRKITRAVANILAGRQKCIYLGNLDAKRDWGFAPEYVEAMWLMLQQDQPADYVIGTGRSHSVRELVEQCFAYVGVDLEWTGLGTGEKGIASRVHERWRPLVSAGQTLIEIDPRYYRPTEVDALQAEVTKARTQLGWEPRTTFGELVKIMCDYDMQLAGLEPPGDGIAISREKGFGYTNHDFTVYGQAR